MPPCRFGKVRPHNNAARNVHESRLPKRMHAAAKSYSVDCVHGIGLLLDEAAGPHRKNASSGLFAQGRWSRIPKNLVLVLQERAL